MELSSFTINTFVRDGKSIFESFITSNAPPYGTLRFTHCFPHSSTVLNMGSDIPNTLQQPYMHSTVVDFAVILDVPAMCVELITGQRGEASDGVGGGSTQVVDRCTGNIKCSKVPDRIWKSV